MIQLPFPRWHRNCEISVMAHKHEPPTRRAGNRVDKHQRNKLLHSITKAPDGDYIVMLTNILRGLAFNSITLLAKALDTPVGEMAALLSISPSALARRKRAGQLRPDESDRVARFARLKDAAVEMMDGDDKMAIEWLHTPLMILHWGTPLIHAKTEMGARTVEDMIVRIQHGVFS